MIPPSLLGIDMKLSSAEIPDVNGDHPPPPNRKKLRSWPKSAIQEQESVCSPKQVIKDKIVKIKPVIHYNGGNSKKLLILPCKKYLSLSASESLLSTCGHVASLN